MVRELRTKTIFVGAKNAVRHTWLVFEVKLWVVHEMINRRAGKIRGKGREKKKAREWKSERQKTGEKRWKEKE